jgi:hypothetical protein
VWSLRIWGGDLVSYRRRADDAEQIGALNKKDKSPLKHAWASTSGLSLWLNEVDMGGFISTHLCLHISTY